MARTEKANPDSLLPEGDRLFATLSGGKFPLRLPQVPTDPAKAEALLLVAKVRTTLAQFREDAVAQLGRVDEESPSPSRYRQDRENYAYMVELLLQAELALGGDGR